MSIASWDEQSLQTFIQRYLDQLGLTRSDSGLKDGSVGKGKLAAGVLNNFLQLLVAADLELAFGTGAATFSGSTVTTNVVINHGLKGTPVWVGVSGTDLNTCWWGHTKSSTQITVRGSYASSLSTTMGFEWAAIG
jgi:hypothetical protein